MIKEITSIIKQIRFGHDYVFECEEGSYTIPADRAITQSRFNPVKSGDKITLVLLGDEIISYKNA